MDKRSFCEDGYNKGISPDVTRAVANKIITSVHSLNFLPFNETREKEIIDSVNELRGYASSNTYSKLGALIYHAKMQLRTNMFVPKLQKDSAFCESFNSLIHQIDLEKGVMAEFECDQQRLEKSLAEDFNHPDEEAR